MPKIVAIDSKTGAPTSEIKIGRQIKAQTQMPNNDIAPKVEAAPIPEGQKPGIDGNSPEAKQLDPKYEALAKKESAFRTRERDFQAKEAAFKAQVAELEAAKSFKQRLLENPLEALNEAGITYDQLVEQAVNAPDASTREIKQELKTIKEAQSKLAEDAQKATQAQRESAITQIRHDVLELVDSDPNFETVKGTGSADDVVELITRTFDESGRLLSIDVAAKMVEDELFEEALKIASLGKVKAKLSPAPTQETKPQLHEAAKSMTTLTNNMTSTRPLTPRERALRVFRGEKL